jgi:hypothetical protein
MGGPFNFAKRALVPLTSAKSEVARMAEAMSGESFQAK